MRLDLEVEVAQDLGPEPVPQSHVLESDHAVSPSGPPERALRFARRQDSGQQSTHSRINAALTGQAKPLRWPGHHFQAVPAFHGFRSVNGRLLRSRPKPDRRESPEKCASADADRLPQLHDVLSGRRLRDRRRTAAPCVACAAGPSGSPRRRRGLDDRRNRVPISPAERRRRGRRRAARPEPSLRRSGTAPRRIASRLDAGRRIAGRRARRRAPVARRHPHSGRRRAAAGAGRDGAAAVAGPSASTMDNGPPDIESVAARRARAKARAARATASGSAAARHRCSGRSVRGAARLAQGHRAACAAARIVL